MKKEDIIEVMPKDGEDSAKDAQDILAEIEAGVIKAPEGWTLIMGLIDPEGKVSMAGHGNPAATSAFGVFLIEQVAQARLKDEIRRAL